MKTATRNSFSMRRAARVAISLAAGIAAMAITSMASADVLYDSFAMITNGTANRTDSAFIGGLGAFPELRDVNVADDFNLAGAFNITSVTGAYFLQTPAGAPPTPGGVLVEFFANTGDNRPAENPLTAVLATNFTATPFFNLGANKYYLSVDLSGHNIQLGAGTWWLSITPVDESATGGHWKQFRQLGQITGFASNRRAGGIDHGNGYAGIIYSNVDWGPFNAAQGGGGDVAMRIEGTVIPGPASLALLGLAGLLGTGRRPRNRRHRT